MAPTSSRRRRERRPRRRINPMSQLLRAIEGMTVESEVPPSAVSHSLVPGPLPALPYPYPSETQPFGLQFSLFPGGGGGSSSNNPSFASWPGLGVAALPGSEAAEVVEWRDWTQLPLDIMGIIFHKIDQIDMLMGAGHVCHQWRRASREMPELWRRIDLSGQKERKYKLCWIAREAINRSRWRCEAFSIERDVNHDLLLFLGNRARSLKSLRLIYCHDLNNQVFADAINRFSCLEELELSLCSKICGQRVFEVVAMECPLLKRFKLNKVRFYNYQDVEQFIHFEENTDEAKGIATLHELQYLQLFANGIKNQGLETILDNCPHLEFLDIRHCFNICLTEELEARLYKIKTVKLPYDSTDDYPFEVLEPLWLSPQALGIDWERWTADFGIPY